MDYTRLYLIRHGQVAGFETPRFNGHTDVDLSPLGREQLEAVAEDLREVELDAVYSSDLQRARYGGEALVSTRGLELRIAPEFREMNFGIWEGLSFDEVEERYPGAMEHRQKEMLTYRMSGGESIKDIYDRIGTALNGLLDGNRGPDPGPGRPFRSEQVHSAACPGFRAGSHLADRSEFRLPQTSLIFSMMGITWSAWPTAPTAKG